MYRPWITKSFHILAAEEHVKAKNEALGKVDTTRRDEFLRRKAQKDQDEETANKIKGEVIRKNFGWPFNIGLLAETEVTKEYDTSWEGVPVCNFCGASHKPMKVCKGCNEVVYCDAKCQKSDWDKSHKDKCKSPSGEHRPEGKANEFKSRSSSVFGQPSFHFEPPAADETDLFHFFKWKRGLLYSVEKQESAVQAAQKMQDKEAGGGGASGGEAALGVKANEPGASGLYWDGPETSLGFLDLMVWKPIAMTGPAVVKQAGAQDTVNLLQKGVAMPVADDLLPKRVYGYQWTERNNISRKTSTLQKGEGALAHTNIQVKDLLTGATIYGIQWSY